MIGVKSICIRASAYIRSPKFFNAQPGEARKAVSRPEIIPKAYSGDFAWDVTKHSEMGDYRFVPGKNYLEICLRGIKQDPLCKRNVAVKGKAWRAIGSCKSHFDLTTWLARMLKMRRNLHLPEDEKSPLFLMKDGRYLIYSKANTIMRTIMDRFLPVGESANFAIGGVRVLSYNVHKALVGDASARVQGMWGSDCVEVYDRGVLAALLGVASRLAEFSLTPSLLPSGALERLPTPTVIVPEVEEPLPTDLVESGWTKKSHKRTSGAIYYTFIRDSDGKSLKSFRALTKFLKQQKASPVVAMVQPTFLPAGYELNVEKPASVPSPAPAVVPTVVAVAETSARSRRFSEPVVHTDVQKNRRAIRNLL